jgi:hypothetical protein
MSTEDNKYSSVDEYSSKKSNRTHKKLSIPLSLINDG